MVRRLLTSGWLMVTSLMVLAGSAQLPAKDFVLETQLFRLPAEIALTPILAEGHETGDDKLLKNVWQLVSAKRGQLLDQTTLKGTNRTGIQGGEFTEYEYSKDFELNDDSSRTKLVTRSKDTRNVGTFIEAYLTPKSGGLVDVNLNYEYHLEPPVERKLSYRDGRAIRELDVTLPEFRIEKLAGCFTAIPGKAVLVTMFSPPRIDQPDKAAFVDLLFARLVGETPEEPAKISTVQSDILVFSVPDALGAAIESKGTKGNELLQQMIGALGAKKAVIETVCHTHQGVGPQYNTSVISAIEAHHPTSLLLPDKKRDDPAMPVDIDLPYLGTETSVYVSGKKDDLVAAWELNLELERPTLADNSANPRMIPFEGAQLDLTGDAKIPKGNATELVNVTTLTVAGQKRRYFTFVRVGT